MKKIYLIRHGQTDYNLHGIVQGSGVDTDLNDNGRNQAMAFFEKYKEIPFDKIYTSCLKRSIQSVQNFIDLNIPWETHQGLNEISWGNKDGKVVKFEDDLHYFNMIKAWGEGEVDRKIEGGESPLDVQLRQKPVIEKILKSENEKNVLICMHGRAMRILLATITGTDLRFMDKFEHTNVGLYLLNFFDGKVVLEKQNDKEHLSKLVQ